MVVVIVGVLATCPVEKPTCTAEVALTLLIQTPCKGREATTKQLLK